jgi:CDGSH-type Zn-finger protein
MQKVSVRLELQKALAQTAFTKSCAHWFDAFDKLLTLQTCGLWSQDSAAVAVLSFGPYWFLSALGFGIWCFSVAMAQVTIETIKNGPYIVTGEVELIDADRNKFPVEKRMALCRCGASTEKPFCDGTHSKIDFQAAEKAVPESKE